MSKVYNLVVICDKTNEINTKFITLTCEVSFKQFGIKN